jgi:ribonuclease HII
LILHTSIIAGVDEAGRAPLAGPVAAGACVLPCKMIKRRQGLVWKSWRPEGPSKSCIIADSKRLTALEREIAYEWIVKNCAWGLALVEAEIIDEIGILAANERAMQEAVSMLARTVKPTMLFVDGRDKFWFDYPHISIVGGDALEPCIAAASIIAKVTRDRRMIEEHKKYPHYNFAKHKGYPTNEHYEAIRKHGLCPLHRKSFLKNFALPRGKSLSALQSTGIL